ncbi:hypothetical protein GCM10011515_02710 [Tsuneonella deserti]|uniref:Autotransporter domain-containing protein n=1 Tax=Tsuneonella deserti TaxID=2035528 RepID=A0ABQ1RXS9_9SPHN|nr:hypothetical protein [Tsuneonella deserti]GGD86662.1 hypothetical protein GCM10011515_02710 [Tsuneonella deserti]
MTCTATHVSRNRRRHALLLAGCALGLVLAAMPEAALAQDANKGFQGSGNVDAGGADIFTFDGGKFTGIDVSTPNAVITWTPDDTATSGTIDFLPNGYSATFSSSNQSYYTVLNRILPGGTATIGLNGTITSTVSNGDGQSPGGNVWFYTPNGFVIGPSAVIQVGGLVMTTNDITYSVDPTSGIPDFLDASGAINFRGPDGSKGSIVNYGNVSAGSYIALVAPRIVQSGYVDSAGGIAYVAAEQADLKINAGDFDIVVGQGTTDANGIVHDGTTTGSAAADYSKTIRFVAVPKNTALTMLLSGGIGYMPATSATFDGGAIVLSAGADGSPDGNISIGATDFTNGVDAHATGDLTVAPPPPGASSEGTSDTIYRSLASLSGDKSVHLTAAGGTRIEARNSLSLNSESVAGGGDIVVQALAGGGLIPDGAIAVTGYLTAYASDYGDTSSDGTTGLDAHGGSITVAADGGQISAQDAYLYAGGYGGFGSKTGGDGYGGRIDIRAGLGGSFTTGYLWADAQGHGGGSYEYTEAGAFGGQGGVGHGGDITLKDSSGPVTADPDGGHLGLGYVYLNANAVGGNSLTSGSGLGGDAFGGTIDITLDRQDQSFGSLSGYARAVDGDGGAMDPVGGDITMAVGGGTALSLDSLYLDTGAEASVNSPAGAFGKGGTIDVSVTDGASVTVAYDAELNSLAEISPFFGAATSSPDLTGGTVSLLADNGSFQANNILVDVSAFNVGADTSAGIAQGGNATVRAANGGSISAVLSPSAEGYNGALRVDAEGYGTGGTFANLATGGNITLASESGATISADAGTIDLNARGEFGTAPGGQAAGVIAQGGGIVIDALGGTIATGIFADAGAQGGDADNEAGSGTGGTIDVRVLGGTLVNSLYASTDGFGGASLVKGDGGDGKGGRFTLLSDADGTFTDFGLTFYGNGIGGHALDGTGGDGSGGSAQVDILGGTHDWYAAYLSARGTGARSSGTTSRAGSAYGSVEGLDFHVGGGADLTLYYLDLDAGSGAGGDGGANEAVGGKANLLVDQLASLTADSIGINASALMQFEERDPTTYDSTPTVLGGTASVIANGGTITTPYLEVVSNGMTGGALSSAGTATGGTAEVGSEAGGLIKIINGVEAIGQLVISARGLGAEGPSAADAFGGTATLYTAGGDISSVSGITVNANAEEGQFADAFASGSSANGFDATGGTASVEMRTGGSGGAIRAPSLSVVADGRADRIQPVQGEGGNGAGGTATLDVAQGALRTGLIHVSASGLGGQAGERPGGGGAFASGQGIGGTASFVLSGGAVDTTQVEIVADGTGAAGIGETSGATGSLAGSGRGGTASFAATGGVLTDTGSLLVEAQGTGGNGAYNANAVGAGGNGATGSGGTALFSASGTASLGIASSISLEGVGYGGLAGYSASGLYGSGGDGDGGIASMELADIAFAFPFVSIAATGNGGYGGTLGTGTGGDASFSLADTSSANAGPRTIDTLVIIGSGYLATEDPSVAGSAAFTAKIGSPTSGLTVTNDLVLLADGSTGPAEAGVSGVISGAPVKVGGSVLLHSSPGDGSLTITGGGALDIAGDLGVALGGSFTSSGPISAAGNAEVVAHAGIDMTDLAVGGSTNLQAINGPVVVSHDLRSGGPVTVLGRSVNLVSLGALTFADADATSGNLEIKTAGDLLLSTADATGAVKLTSTGGSIHNTGAVNGNGIFYAAGGNVVSDQALASTGALGVDAGGTFSAPGVSAAGNVSLSADLGMTLTSVVSGGTTFLAADNGALSIASLTSPGLVTARGRSITIGSPGALSFANAQATAGDLRLTTAGNLSLAQGGAFGALVITSTGGSVSGTGAITAGGDATVDGHTGISLAALTSEGETSLASSSGAVAIDDLNSAGLVTASGRSITIGSSGALSFAALDATASNITVESAGNLAVDTVTASGIVSLTSTDGGLQGTGAINGSAITLSSLADLNLTGALTATGAINLTSTSGSVSASGLVDSGSDLAVSGKAGISLGQASSGGTTALTSANGAISVTDLSSLGLVTATGLSITIGSSGALDFADIDATDGDIAVQTAGDLVLATADATGAVRLTSTGGSIHNTGAVNGKGIFYTTAGDVVSDAALASTGDLGVDAGGIFSAPGVAATGNVSLSADEGLSLTSVESGGTTFLAAENGALAIASLTSSGLVTASGRSVMIGSPGALSFADAQATAGDLAVTTAGDLSLAQGKASGALNLTSTGGSVIGTGPLGSGGNSVIDGQSGVTVARLTSGGTTSLTSAGGSVDVAELIATGQVAANGRSVTIASSGALSFSDLDANDGDIAVQTAGNLAVGPVDATGAVALTSTGGALQIGGAINGNGIALSSLADLMLAGDLATVGAISLTSTSGSVSSDAAIAAGSDLTVSGNSGITLGKATSGGTTSLTSSGGAVLVTNLMSAGPVTASGRSINIGSSGALDFADLDATQGDVLVQTAGNLSVNTVDAEGSVALTSTGEALQVGGAIKGNGIALSSLASLQLDAALSTPGSLSLTSTSGSVNAANALSAGSNVSVSGQTGVSLGALTSGGTTSLIATNGNISVAALSSAGGVTASGRAIDLRSPGSLTVLEANASSGDLLLQAAQDLTLGNGSASGAAMLSAGDALRSTGQLNAGSVQMEGATIAIGGQVRASGDLAIIAGQLFSLTGSAAGKTIAVDSGDIAIGTTGRLGIRGLTETITLRNLALTSPMNIGGTGQQGQYSLDKNEATRLFADRQIALVSRGGEGAGGDVNIGDLAMAFGDGANIGAGGLLKVDAGGRVEVNGAVELTTVSDADTFSIDPSRIDVLAGSGSIVMRNARGAVQGILELEADTIAIADRNTLDAIASLTDFQAISAALDKPAPAGPEGGYLQAGTINLIVGDALFVQNAGTSTEYDARRGFLANELNIETSSSDPMIAINGVISRSSGDLTGLDTAQAVSINGEQASQLSRGMTITINGCAVGVNCGVPEYVFGGQSNDDLELFLTSNDEAGDGPAAQLVQVEDNQPLITPPLVDEPITGVGNDDLWQVKCSPENDKQSCPAEEGSE